MKTHNYEKFAGTYSDIGIKGTFYLAFRDLPDLFKKYVTGKLALDYGCGAGRSKLFLEGHGFNVIGADKERKMIAKAHKTDPHGKYCLIEKERGALPFEKGVFDLVLSSIVFEEIPTHNKMINMLKKMNRVLKDEGTAIIITNTPEAYTREWVSFISNFKKVEDLKSGDKAKTVGRGGEYIFYDYVWFDEDHERAFKEAGLKLIGTYKPLATGKEPPEVIGRNEWINETETPSWVIYLLKK